MYTQLYFHHVRRIYDYHLTEFLKTWLPGGRFSAVLSDHLAMTDNEVNAAMLLAAYDARHPGHKHARAIFCRDHFRLLYERNPKDLAINPKATEAIAKAAVDKFGEESIHKFLYPEANKRMDFPVQHSSGTVNSSLDESTVLAKIPVVMVEFIFVAADKRQEASSWLNAELPNIIKPLQEDGQ